MSHLSFRKAGVIAVLLGALIVGLPASAGASYYRDRQRELQRLINEKESRIRALRAQARDVISEITASNQRLAVVQARLDDLAAKLADARAHLAAVEAHLDKVSAQMRAKTALLEWTLGDLNVHTDLLNKRVTDVYINAPIGYGQALMMAEDFSDVVAANEYEAGVVRNDQALVASIVNAKEKIEEERAAIAVVQAQLEQDRNEAAAETQRISQLVSLQRAAVNERAAEIAYQTRLLHRIDSRRAFYIRAVKAMQAESSSITALLRGAQAGQRVVQGVGGYLKWPVSGPITSSFGWREHPVYHYRSFHTGIDIGVGSGTTVKSARRGTVIFTGYKGAYGLVVIIDHGGQLATMYAHLSRVFVNPGERVRTLQSIAASGNTGWSTGPHLHFEVRSQGEPVNPMLWL